MYVGDTSPRSGPGVDQEIKLLTGDGMEMEKQWEFGRDLFLFFAKSFVEFEPFSNVFRVLHGSFLFFNTLTVISLTSCDNPAPSIRFLVVV